MALGRCNSNQRSMAYEPIYPSGLPGRTRTLVIAFQVPIEFLAAVLRRLFKALLMADDVISGLNVLRRDLHTIGQGVDRKIGRVDRLMTHSYDVGEEGVRLNSLKLDITILRTEISELTTQIKNGHATDDHATQLYENIVQDVELARTTLEDIRVPHFSQVMAAERLEIY